MERYLQQCDFPATRAQILFTNINLSFTHSSRSPILLTYLKIAADVGISRINSEKGLRMKSEICKAYTARLCQGAALFTLSMSLVSVNAFAQTTDSSALNAATAGEVAAPDDIIVTGSRIARPDLASSSPVAVVSAEAIKQTNTVTVEQILASNPQFTAAFGSASNNPGDGSATVDLRGLDEKRTLVLIDGKRAPTYDTTGAVDVNSIPTALLKRVEVLTGGASAVYGSDAVAGVVNFILDDRFEGLRADGSSQITGRGDGALYDLSLTGGLALGDRGNLVVSGGYSKRNGVKFGARKRNSVALDSSDLVSSGGSSNGVPTIFDLADGSQVQITDDGTLTDDVQLYNFTPVNYAQVPFERYNAMALLRYDLTDGIEFYGRANYSRIKVNQTLAPTATAGFTFNIDPANPFLTDDERAVFFGPDASIITPETVDPDDPSSRVGSSTIGIRRRIVETGGRIEINKTKNMQFVGGLRGDIGDSLHWDTFAQYGQSKKSRDFLNDLSYTALTQALDVVAGPDGPQCFDPSGGCVPLNLFTTATIPQSELAFVLRNGREDTKITQFIAGGNLSGDLGFLKSPWADEPAAFSVGVEYRREKGTTAVDANYGSGDLIYYGQGQNISGKYNVKEIYAELKIPIVQDKPFIYALNLEGGFRYSDYSTVGSVYTYKAGGDWSPAEGFRLRGIYQRAVRAPNIYELYSPVVAGTGSLTSDPCAGSEVPSSIAAICIAQGAPASTIGSIQQPISGQINIFTGGNLNLTEEKSDTYTIGVVINPPSMKRLSIAIDYFNIDIKNAITETSPFNTIDQCYNVTQDINSAACQGIVRNTLTGSLSGNTEFGVASVLGNIQSLKTDGIDVTASYLGGEATGFSWGISFSGTYTRNYKKDDTQCAGRFGSACNLEPIAKWKHVANVNFGWKGVNFATRWRYFGTVKQDASRYNPDGSINEDNFLLRHKIGGYSYFDETVSFDINDAFTLRAGVQNVFDKKSPIVGDTVGADPNAGSTFPNTYDVLGRTFFAGASVKF